MSKASDPTNVADDSKDHSDHTSSPDTDHEPFETTSNNEQASSSAVKPKKKKKKTKSKAAKALSAALRGKSAAPQELVDQILAKVKEEHGENAEGANEETVRMALDYLKINDVIKGKAALGGFGKKDMGEHKVSLLYSLGSLLMIWHSSGLRNLCHRQVCGAPYRVLGYSYVI